ncbi:MAG: YceI family protein [Candidatus Acidiferrales bacterium]
MAPENVGPAHRAIEAKARLFTVQALAAGTVMQTGTQKGIAPVKYAMDTVASRFTVQAFATGMLSAFGHNPTIAIRDYDGEIEFVAESVENAAVRVTVRTSGMEVVDEMKSDDRKKLEQAMYEQVLEATRFPSAVYESKQITVQKQSNELWQAHVTGQLTFHGVTQSLAMDARVTTMGTMLRVAGEFPLRQSDYGIKPGSFAGGALKLKDELKFNFEMVCRKQE